MKSNHRHHTRRAGKPGFTLIEILVVISLFVLLLAIGVPAFASLLRSSERSLAGNALATAIRAARDIAQRSEGGDGALVFSMDPGGRLSMVPCIQVGQVLDRTSTNTATGQQEAVRRDVFVPHPLFKTSQLPTGWTVRGFASAGTIDGDWYGDFRNTNAYKVQATTPSQSTNTEPQWVLPETGYFKGNQFAASASDPDKTTDNGRNRQTFMLRFASGTGEVTSSPSAAIIVLPITPDPNQLPVTRAITLPGNKQYVRARDAAELRTWATQILNDAAFDASATTRIQRLELLGDESVDTALAKTVPWLTMASERQIASDLAKGKVASGPLVGQTLAPSLDRRTASLYAAGEEPVLVGADPTKLARVLNAMVNGQMVSLTQVDDKDNPLPLVPEAQVFLVSAYQGNTLEIRQ